MTDKAVRFIGRAKDYALGRPDYPDAVVDTLEAEGLQPAGLVVDVGAGTGISSRVFLRRGYRVIAIEPNAEMRAAAIGSGVDCRDGRGEATGLPSGSADLVICAQAFHWLHRDRAWAEFHRVARPGGLLALMWNIRVTRGTPFVEGLELLLHEHCAEDPAVSEGAHLRQWPGTQLREFRHEQRLNWDALRGRVSSMSYMPRPGSPEHAPMIEALRHLFDETNSDGLVSMIYDCRLYWLRKE